MTCGGQAGTMTKNVGRESVVSRSVPKDPLCGKESRDTSVWQMMMARHDYLARQIRQGFHQKSETQYSMTFSNLNMHLGETEKGRMSPAFRSQSLQVASAVWSLDPDPDLTRSMPPVARCKYLARQSKSNLCSSAKSLSDKRCQSSALQC
jgi:hypothetical protein